MNRAITSLILGTVDITIDFIKLVIVEPLKYLWSRGRNKMKAKIEKDFVRIILSKGGVKRYCCMSEGHNNYYRLELKNGEIRYWGNLSTESLNKLGIGEKI